MYDYAVIGGGILGMATARELLTRQPGADVVVFEKEPDVARHQSGHNSGVIHAGVYYAPGSLKARLGVAGNASMVEFCRLHDIPHEVCGKVIVAATNAELPRLSTLYERGKANGVPLELVDVAAVRAIEPDVNCVAGIVSPTTGVVDFAAVTRKLRELCTDAGARVLIGARVKSFAESAVHATLQTTRGEFNAAQVVNCAGLHSDRIARMAGVDPGVRIVPFRGEYVTIGGRSAELVKHLIYPVPDPAFPFLGVHLTRGVDGTVHAGPNAVLALSREGYRRRSVNPRDLAETLRFGGFWKLSRGNVREGAAEQWRSFSRRAFVKSLQRLVPGIDAADVAPGGSGVRAQALTRDGRLADDFVIVRGRRSTHVCNAPSPAATASLEIARHIVDQLPEVTLSSTRS
jgi:L-2-hydroxyglutarate oxidase